MCTHVYIHMHTNGTYTSDYPLHQISYWLLDCIYPKSRHMDKLLGNYSVPSLLPSPALPNWCSSFPDMSFGSQCVCLGLFTSFLLSSQLLKVTRVLPYIPTKITNHTCFICKKSKQFNCASYCQGLLFSSCVVKVLALTTASFKPWFILLLFGTVFMLVVAVANHLCYCLFNLQGPVSRKYYSLTNLQVFGNLKIKNNFKNN